MGVVGTNVHELLMGEEPTVGVLSARYVLDKGEHPRHATAPAFFSLPMAVDVPMAQAYHAAGLPLDVCVHGHTVMQDGPFTFVLSPLFVRDLAGRVIYVGYGPESKADAEWGHEAAGLERAKDLRRITFPRHCEALTPEVVGAEKVEQVFMTLFRALDVQPQAQIPLTGTPEVKGLVTYDALNLYPYKLRLDTFYADGYRLPQVEMLFAKGVKPELAEAAAKDLLEKWQARPAGQTYAQFYEANAGDAWFAELFEAGCTVIPTLEACNGYNKVSAQFELEDFWAGRAVKGLHVIAETRSDPSPRNTILEVLEPGFVTRERIHPARVVVSDGKSYKTPHGKDTPALWPDLQLPHPRTGRTWGRVYVPTQPSHFEEPALWGWEPQTGRFMQYAGPLWDPLHYYYASVPLVLRAFRTRQEGGYVVPEEMKRRFYPVVAPLTYDTLSFPTLQTRQKNHAPLVSAIDRVALGKPACTVGYHPLPLVYEHELEVFCMPELSARVRGIKPCPEPQKLVPVMVSHVSADVGLQAVVTTPESLHLKTPAYFRAPEGGVLADYPQLRRYLKPEMQEGDAALVPLIVADVAENELLRNIRRAMGGARIQNQLEDWQAGLFEALRELREKSLWWRRLRHRLVRKYRPEYVACWWHMADVVQAAEQARKHYGDAPDVEPTDELADEESTEVATEGENNAA
ncbi:MAG: hypothetical protein WAX89_05430 [Alphaproteobacteria bacterium]